MSKGNYKYQEGIINIVKKTWRIYIIISTLFYVQLRIPLDVQMLVKLLIINHVSAKEGGICAKKKKKSFLKC